MDISSEALKKQLHHVATLIDANNTSLALKLVDQILLANPGNIYAILQKSLALINQGNISQAQNILDSIDTKNYSANINSKIAKLNSAIRSKCWRSLPAEIQHYIFSLVDAKYLLYVCKQWQSVALAEWFTLHEVTD